MNTYIKWATKLTTVALAVVLCGIPMLASADQQPTGCNANNLDLVLAKDKTIVRPGEVITYSVYASNVNNGSSLACNITDATTTITLPAADGTPLGQVVTVASGQSYPAGTVSALLGTAMYTVAVNPGVADVVAEGNVQGVLHDAPVDHAANITKTVGTSVTQPHISVIKNPNPVTTRPNVDVPFTYDVTNDSTASSPIRDPSITDTACAPIRYVSGDVNTNSILDMGETWHYTCNTVFRNPGTFTSTVVVTGIDTADNRPIASDSYVSSITVSRFPGLPNTGSGPEDMPAKTFRGVASLVNPDTLFRRSYAH